MCGIAGFLTSERMDSNAISAALGPMIDCLAHRGPDQKGTWSSPEFGVGLGFRRLAIVDLSAEGHQPMASASDRYTMIFNGEVYNFGDLRKTLETRGHRISGHSDTAVILASFEEWGVVESLPKFNGMFALAVWDAQEKLLTLARDRLGIKPLFVFHRPGFTSFGSELKALTRAPSFERQLDPSSLESYLRYLYVPAPQTIYKNTIKLLPGCYVQLRSADQDVGEPIPYWSLNDAYHRSQATQITSDQESVELLEELLLDSVRMRMISDVPLGALLSGGIDSSTVVALMQEVSDRPVKTYTIGFGEAEFDESSDARVIAQHLGTDHTELKVNGNDALEVIPQIPTMFDEPLADPSQIPTYLVSKLARRDVTVVLSGDGGDELFAGYNRYRFGVDTINRVRAIPAIPRRLIGSGLGMVSAATLARAVRIAASVVPGMSAPRLLDEKIRKVRHLLPLDSRAEMYRSLMSIWQRPSELVNNMGVVPDRAHGILMGHHPVSLSDRMMLADQTTYLPDDLLAKVDRASMAVSLEARVPILDHRIVELAWRMPPTAKVKGGVTKWALRQVLHKRVPSSLMDRPKIGFTVPIEAWLRGPLRSWADDLLSPDKLGKCDLLRAAPILHEWNALKAGNGSGIAIWTVLMFQAWREEWS
jgi:asparagine synthase (glutamine-hydrolysing)